MRCPELVCLFVVGLTCGGDAYVHSLYDEYSVDIGHDDISEYEQDCDLVITSNGQEVTGHAVGYAGEFTQLVCDASCIGTGVTPSVSWYRGESSHSGRLIRPIVRRIHTHTKTFSRYGVLTIYNMLGSDKGAYTCRGWLGSVVGWVEKTVYLDYGCLAPRFSCDASRCLDQTSRCDGIRNCQDGFDELHCQERCEHQCDGHCLDIEKWCDDHHDCWDGADERDCECAMGDFTCGYGECNCTTTDCVDQDECLTTTSPEVTTSIPEVTTTTVPEVMTTSLQEPITVLGCSSIEYECNGGNCIPWEYMCDGEYDCYDADDEDGCPTATATTQRATSTTTTRAPPTTTPRCSSIEYECSNGTCIPLAYTCDGVVDCSDGEDEDGCPTPTTTTPRATSTITSRAQPTTTSRAQPTTSPRAPSTTTSREQPTTTPSVQSTTTPLASPTTTSRAQPTTTAPAPPTTTSRVQPTTKSRAPQTTTPQAPSTTTPRVQPTTQPSKTTPRAPKTTTASGCTKKQFDCGDGQCIPVENVCNAFPDCQNGVDEQEKPCGRKLTCQEGQVPCKNQQACINREFLCDGTSHCSDASDEENCPQETRRVAVKKSPTSTVGEE